MNDLEAFQDALKEADLLKELPRGGNLARQFLLLVSQSKPDNKTPQSTRDIYMVVVNQISGSVFVKDLEFFRSQGGFTEDWGRNWFPIVATSIEDAREKGCEYPGARPYNRQAK